MQGSIIQINISPGGLPKHPVSAGLISFGGLDGDGHAHPRIHGGPRKASVLIASEVVEEESHHARNSTPRSADRRPASGGRSAAGDHAAARAVQRAARLWRAPAR